MSFKNISRRSNGGGEKHIERKLTERRRKKIRNGIRDLERLLQKTAAEMDPELVRQTLEKNVRDEGDVIAQRTQSGFRAADAGAMHQLRIRVKGLRYMIEIVHPQRNTNDLCDMQTKMGELHDLLELDQAVSQWAKDEGIRGTDVVKALHAEIGKRRSRGWRRLKSAPSAYP